MNYWHVDLYLSSSNCTYLSPPGFGSSDKQEAIDQGNAAIQKGPYSSFKLRDSDGVEYDQQGKQTSAHKWIMWTEGLRPERLEDCHVFNSYEEALSLVDALDAFAESSSHQAFYIKPVMMDSIAGWTNLEVRYRHVNKSKWGKEVKVSSAGQAWLVNGKIYTLKEMAIRAFSSKFMKEVDLFEHDGMLYGPIFPEPILSWHLSLEEDRVAREAIIERALECGLTEEELKQMGVKI